MQQPTAYPTAPPSDRFGVDEHRFLLFLGRRLREEVVAARARRDASTGARRAHADRALGHITSLLDDVQAGIVPDRTTIRLLILAYAGHPEFDRRWRDDTHRPFSRCAQRNREEIHLV